MPTLYRTYRPQTFAAVAGQEAIKLTIGFEVTAGRLAHAYLFCGPRAVGKTTMARLLAKSVNCLKRKEDTAEPCNKCQNCSEITDGSSLDVLEVDAASHTGVDNVRDAIIGAARIVPSSSKYKVFIIDEVHMLSTAAFNALLKVMEEPPQHVIFVLCTTEAHKLPATIISRCQRFDFRKISQADVVTKLNSIIKAEGIKVEPAVIETIARHSGGHLRDAESLLGQVIALGSGDETVKGKIITQAEAELIIPRSLLNEALDLAEFLSTRDASGAVGYINQLSDNGVDLRVFASEAVALLRHMLLGKVNPALTAAEYGETVESRVVAMNDRFDPPFLAFAIERIGETRTTIKDAPIPQLPLELAIIDICFGRLSEASESPVSPAMPSMPRATQTPRPAASTAPQMPSEASKTASAPALTDAALRDAWMELLGRIRQHNHSLAFVLMSCQILGMEGNDIKIAFKYKIHHDRINEPTIRNLVEGLLAEICARPIVLRTALDPELIIVDNRPEVAAAVSLGSDGGRIDAGPRYDANGELIRAERAEAPALDSAVIDNLLKTFGGKVVS